MSRVRPSGTCGKESERHEKRRGYESSSCKGDGPYGMGDKTKHPRNEGRMVTEEGDRKEVKVRFNRSDRRYSSVIRNRNENIYGVL